MNQLNVPAAAQADGAPGADADLVERLGDVTGAHVAVIGAGALETMCALIRAGCGAVVEIAAADRAAIEPVEIAVIPRAASLQAVVQAIPVAIRALLPGGRIVLRDQAGLIAPDLAAALRARGFSEVTSQPSGSGRLVMGTRPALGHAMAGALA